MARSADQPMYELWYLDSTVKEEGCRWIPRVVHTVDLKKVVRSY